MKVELGVKILMNARLEFTSAMDRWCSASIDQALTCASVPRDIRSTMHSESAKIWTNVYIAVTSAPRMHDVRIPMVRTDVSARMDSHLERTAEFATILMNASVLECVSRHVEIPGDHSSVCVTKDIAWHQMGAHVTMWTSVNRLLMLAFRCAMVCVKTRMDPMNVPVHQDTKWPVTVVPVKI